MRNAILMIVCGWPLLLWSQIPNQKQIDSLLADVKIQKQDTAICNTYNKIARVYLYRNPAEGRNYANKALVMARKINWPKGKATAHLYLGMLLVSEGKYTQALQNLNSSKAIFTQTNDVFNLAKTNNEIGILMANQSKYPEALAYFFQSLHDYEQLGFVRHRFGIASCYENIGTVYNLSNTYDKAAEYYQKAINIRTTLKNNTPELANVMSSLGVIYQKQGENQKALAIFKSAQQKLVPVRDAFSIATIKSFIGTTYLALEQYDLSIENSKAALDAVVKSGDKQLAATTIGNIGNAYLRKAMRSGNQNELTAAFENLNRALQMHHELGNQEGLIWSYNNLSEYYAYRKDFEKSLEMHRQYAIYKDSIFNFKNRQSLQNMENERTIQLRDKQIELNNITLQSKEKEQWFYIFGIGFLFVIAGLVWIQSRNRKKNNQKLQVLNTELDQANKVKARFFSILNHDLRSPVSNLISLLYLKKDSPELLDAESKKRMELKTITSAENLLDSMEDLLLWSKGQMEDFKPHPTKCAVASIFLDLEKHFWTAKIHLVFENTGSMVLFTDEDYVKTILRNLIGNAIQALRHTQEAKVVVKAYFENGASYISVADNGPGGTQEKFRALYDDTQVIGITTGLGLHLVRDLAKAIGCNVSVTSQPEKGAVFTLSFV